MSFALKHIYYDSYHLGNTFKSPFYPVNPEVIVLSGATDKIRNSTSIRKKVSTHSHMLMPRQNFF